MARSCRLLAGTERAWLRYLLLMIERVPLTMWSPRVWLWRLTHLLVIVSLVGCREPLTQATSTPPPGGDGLVGRYYASRDWSGPILLERTDQVIVFDWSSQHPIAAPIFSVRWEGFLVIPPGQGGSYTLFLRSDDASWLYLNGALLIDNGGIHTAQLRSGQVDLAPGPHRIRIDYAELAPSLSLIVLEWRPPFGERGTIPGAVLYSREPSAR